MNMQFRQATKQQSRLRMALIGPSGSGKTYTALKVAQYLGQRVAVIDTERGSASKYADIFAFDVLELDSFSPMTYVEAIKAAQAGGYDVLIIDSLSHAWMGKDGALEQVDRAAKRSQSNNSYTAWRDVTPMHNALVDAMLQSNCHIIGTMRAKTEYVIEQNERGKSVPRKVGLAPVQRDGLEYEFDVVGDMNLENDFVVSKTRCSVLAGQIINKPGEELAKTLRTWLSDGAPATVNPPQPATVAAAVEQGGEVVDEAPAIPAAVQKAMDVTTKKGTRLADLNDSQLETLTTVKDNDVLKKAATTLLNWRIDQKIQF
jgi:hypothetical protein